MTKDELLNTLADMVAERMTGPVTVPPDRPYSQEQVFANERERDSAKKAANLLFGAFSWNDTREGLKYWDKIRQRLLQIAEDGKL